MTYGVPYQGSKNAIAEKVVGILPAGARLVDLFCGGCAITHCALLSGKWHSVLANDRFPWGLELFSRAVAGRYASPPEFVTRRAFFALRDKSPLVRAIASFGNDARTYCFGRDVEEVKRRVHDAVAFARPAGKVRGVDTNAIAAASRSADGRYRVARRLLAAAGLQPSEEQFSRWKRIAALKGLDASRLATSRLDYREVKLEAGDVVYCDIPYEGTTEYAGAGRFDHAAFLRWEAARAEPTFVSSYKPPSPDFSLFAAFPKAELRSASVNGVLTEGVYVHRRFRLDASA